MRKSGRKIYAAYGSNMNLERMKQRCPEAKVIGTGILKEYKLVFRGLHRGVANIEKAQDSEVPIVLWEITERCETALDFYEGYPRLYGKSNIYVKTDEELMEAMVYVMTKQYAHGPKLPTNEYYSIIATGYKEHDLDDKPLKEAFIEVAESVTSEEV